MYFERSNSIRLKINASVNKNYSNYIYGYTIYNVKNTPNITINDKNVLFEMCNSWLKKTTKARSHEPLIKADDLQR